MDALLLALERYRVPLSPLYPVTSVLPGEWDSVYTGEGFELDSVRNYRVGDNIRRVNPRLSAKRGIQTVVERVAQRDLTVVVYCDKSPSMFLREKFAAQINAAAMLLYSAYKCESSFELAWLGERGALHPRRGENQFLSVYHALCQSVADRQENQEPFFPLLLRSLRAPIQPHSIVCILSDFLGPANPALSDKRFMRELAWRYDIIPIVIQDDLEYTFPAFPHSLAIRVDDAESSRGVEAWLEPKNQQEIRRLHEERFALLQAFFLEVGVEPVAVQSGDLSALFQLFSEFFLKRKKMAVRR